MIGLAERVLGMMRRAKLSLHFGEEIGWALWTDEQFFKGSFSYTSKNASDFLKAFVECVPVEVYYRALPKDANADQITAAKSIRTLCEKAGIPLTGITSAKIKLVAPILSEVKKTMDAKGWFAANNDAAMALAIMEVARGNI
jgi:hypothetical protein